MGTQSRKFQIHEVRRGSAVAVHVIPHSSKDELNEIQQDGTVKVLLKSVAGDPGINERLIIFLAQILNAKVYQFEIIAGIRDQLKLITISGVDPVILEDCIQHNVRKAIKKRNKIIDR